MPSPNKTNGPIVKTGPTAGQNRSKNKDGQWRKKRNDSNTSREKKDGLCFISTAVCQHRGLPDDCNELMILRKFRDDYLLKSLDGTKLVSEYYQIAPKIVKSMTTEEDLNFAWVGIQKCLILIQENSYSEAIHEYKKMVFELSKLKAK